MDGFEKAVEFVLEREGGYVNNPKDPGGETNFGISKRAYPGVDVKNLSRDAAKEIYRKDYWEPLGLGDLPAVLGLTVFDSAVNQGKAKASELLREAFRRQSGTELAGSSLDSAARAKIRETANANPGTARALAVEFLLARLRHYDKLCRAKPDLRNFLRGWLARVCELSEKL